jgi:hypothetical protein
MTKQQDAVEAQRFVEQEYPGDGICGVAITYTQDQPIVTVYVDKKLPRAECSKPVEKAIRTNSGSIIRTNIVEVGTGGFRSYELRSCDRSHILWDGVPPYALAADGFDRIYDKIVGGLEIAPDGANWLGTLGGLFMSSINGRTVYGALTNAHVTGLNAVPGTLMMQPNPSYQAGGFGRVVWVSPFSKTTPNLIDAGVIDCHVKEGKWLNNERWTVHPEQFKIGPLSLRWKDPVVGMRVVKCGRTTGVTRGTCISVNTSDSVNYGQDGTFNFIRQAHFKGDSGDLSGPGDSGSYILEESTKDVVAHLFAGGGGITIAYPIRHVIEKVNGRFREN